MREASSSEVEEGRPPVSWALRAGCGCAASAPSFTFTKPWRRRRSSRLARAECPTDSKGSVASRPAKARSTSLPPGWSSSHEVTS